MDLRMLASVLLNLVACAVPFAFFVEYFGPEVRIEPRIDLASVGCRRISLVRFSGRPDCRTTVLRTRRHSAAPHNPALEGQGN